MVSFSVSSMFFHEYTTPEIFSYVSQSGLSGVEYWLETPHFWLRELPVGELLESRMQHPDLSTVTLHAPVLDLNPCSINPEVAEVSVAYSERSAGIAEQLGVDILTVHPGRRTAKRPPGEADYRRFGHYLKRLHNAALKHSVKICMENMEPAVNAILCTPERMRSLLDDEPWLFFTLDVAHALTKSPDEPITYIELCHDRLRNIHLSRVAGKKIHLPLARDPVIRTVLETLLSYEFDGSITLEIEDLNLGKQYSLPEKIALLADEVAFMQDCIS